MEKINLLDLYAKITLDDSEYNEGLDRASGTASSFASKVGRGLATAAKVGAAALSVAAGGIAALTKASVENYAEYEQLVGGVKTLFKDSAENVQGYAENAFKTAGMSASEYMSTVTSFSASLLQGLDGDTAKAAKIADRAITDMADNANKMGTSMDMVQNAYQGFAKQNYTMLDNLKLGYGGTATEMARLINDSGVLGDTITVTADTVNQVSFDKIIEAIGVVQDQMGITGATQDEVVNSIQGSVSSMKSAWANLVTGIGDKSAKLEELIENFVNSVDTVGKNLMPRVVKILDGIGQLVVQMAPVIAEAVPQIAEQVLPSLLSAATTLILALITSMPSIIQPLVDQAPFVISSIVTSLVEMLPIIVDMGMQLLVSLANGIAESLPTLVPAIVEVVMQIVDTLTDPTTLAALIDAAIAIQLALASGLIEALPKLIEKAPEIIANLVTALVENVPKLLEAAWETIKMLAQGLVDAIPQIWEAGKEIVRGLWDGIQSMASWIKDKVTGFFSGIVDGVKGLLGIHSPSRVFADMGKNMALGLGEGWDKSFGQIKSDIEGGMNFEGDHTVSTKTAGINAGGVTFSGLTINISGANYSDENALAEAISYRLQQMVDRRAAVYA